MSLSKVTVRHEYVRRYRESNKFAKCLNKPLFTSLSLLSTKLTHNSHFQKENVEIESNDSVAHGVWHGSNCICQFLPYWDSVSVVTRVITRTDYIPGPVYVCVCVCVCERGGGGEILYSTYISRV